MMDGAFMSRLTINRIELALLLAFAFTALWGAASAQKQEELAEKMVRLHVIAQSDSDADQAVKLLVRDNVLSFTQGLMKGVSGVDAAERIIEDHLGDIQRIANATLAESGCDYTAKAEVKVTEFPEKTYDSFALPGGKYLALRVLLGEAEGKNWWCVVYPPLCTASAVEWEETAEQAGLSGEEIALMKRESTGYEIRFKVVELWQKLRVYMGK
ncbi:MAG: stage II sporulation protein R [Oscillospiraceae bacterium]|nr:stage II sporulation protein R [Oscillospiraceae bacterium]